MFIVPGLSCSFLFYFNFFILSSKRNLCSIFYCFVGVSSCWFRDLALRDFCHIIEFWMMHTKLWTLSSIMTCFSLFSNRSSNARADQKNSFSWTCVFWRFISGIQATSQFLSITIFIVKEAQYNCIFILSSYWDNESVQYYSFSG